MKTPIRDFVNQYLNEGKIRLHMPGHKGNNVLGVEGYDITEIDGADVLYNAQGIIKQSRDNARALFGSGATFYSAEGSSLSIRAMLHLALAYGRANGKSSLVAAGRNAHKAFMSSAALLDFDIDWLAHDSEDGIVRCSVTPEYLEEYLSFANPLPVAVYVTSPDYLGNILDIRSLAEICKKYSVLLLVDNAHGAYLNFLPVSQHPMALGADMCADSAHKTLPVLTGGAYLHISENAPTMLADMAESALELYSSSSPSYLILQSLDMANAYISNGYAEKLADFSLRVDALKSRLIGQGYTLTGNEPLKITVMPKSRGYTGYELAEIMSKNNLVCEFCDPDHTVFMLTPELPPSSLDLLEKALLSVSAKEALDSPVPAAVKGERAMSVRQAMMSASKEIDVSQSLGTVLASPCVSCPPAVPILVCGEIITEEAIKCFEYYGVSRVRIVCTSM